MKRTKKFNEIFKNMKVERAKEWRVTTSRVVHKDKRKEASKRACRKRVVW